MANSIFRFKQFAINQDRCAMKVGTDGVLLGAWSGQEEQPKRILDIGTGTGLIALMMAQRFPEAKVTALEIAPRAAEQAAENIADSPFAERVEVVQADIFEWEPKQTFDLIVCNPPFYPTGLPAATPERTAARHAGNFSFAQLLNKVQELSHQKTTLGLVLPHHIYQEISFSDFGWHPLKNCVVYPTPNKPAHRILSDFKKCESTVSATKLIIETGQRHQYSDGYRELTKNFYLKF